MTMMMKMKKIQ